MIKKSPIHYMGSKEKLLNQLLPLFPEKIEIFYDLFGGSGVVSLNVNAKKYVLNDFSNHIYNLYKMFKTKSYQEIIDCCYQQQSKYNFSTNLTEKKEIAKHNKESFKKMRDDVNKNPSTIGYFILQYYSFCNQFRFSKSGKYNMPVGNGYFKKENEIDIKNFCSFFKENDVEIFNKSYEEIDVKNNSFVYMDIPYCNTNAVYNETSRDLGGWTEKNDIKFFKYCEELNHRNIQWCVSNVFSNKGLTNNHLIDWCNKNNWNVVHLNMTYASHGINNHITDEVAIMNYNPNCFLF